MTNKLYEHIVEKLEAFCANHCKDGQQRADRSDLLDLIDTFEPLKLASLLKRIIEDDGVLAEIASRSYLHPNGFYRIGLFKTSQGGEVRFHLWNANPDLTNAPENIHFHPWDMISYPLSRSFENHSYKIIKIDNPSIIESIENLRKRIIALPADERAMVIECMGRLEAIDYGTTAEEVEQTHLTSHSWNIQRLADYITTKLDCNAQELALLVRTRQGFFMPPRDPQTGLYTPEESGWFLIEHQSVELVEAHAPYYHPYEIPHKVVVPKDNAGITATVVFTTPIAVPNTFFFERVGQPERPTRDARPLSAEQVKKLIIQYLEQAESEPCYGRSLTQQVGSIPASESVPA